MTRPEPLVNARRAAPGSARTSLDIDAFATQPIVTPAAVLAWRERLGGKAIEPVPARALLVMDGPATGSLARARRLRERPGPAGRLLVARGGAHTEPTGLLAVLGIGGPAVAVAIEELVALGAREVVSVGLAGGLGLGVSCGDVVVLDGALPRDGTSAAYGSTDRFLAADESLRTELVARLARAGVDHRGGRSWTTDAVYRESPSRVGEAIDAGAVAVEMEAAAVLAVSRALGIRAAAIVVIADRIVGGRWLPPDDLARCRRAEAVVIDALLDR